jgi:hypothetical protein
LINLIILDRPSNACFPPSTEQLHRPTFAGHFAAACSLVKAPKLRDWFFESNGILLGI